jgi:prepilin-type N-terminal cleavage/methylation domain-containing protein
MTPTALYRRRAGFTLVELLVVIFLITVLAAITVTVARSSITDSYTTTGATDRLSGWLLIAKNRALRDRTPVGVRLIRDPANPLVVREAQYIEMPLLWAPNQNPDGFALSQTSPPPPFVVVRYDAGPGGYRQEDGGTNYGLFVFGLDLPSFDVKIGDLIRISDFNTTHRIDNIQLVKDASNMPVAPGWYPGTPQNLYPPVSAAYPCYKLTLTQSVIPLRANEQFPPSPPNPPMLLPIPQPPFGQNLPPAGFQTALYPANYPPLAGDTFYRTYFFGIYRSARPILGEPLVSLPAGMVIDVTPDWQTTAAAYPVYRNPSSAGSLPGLAPYFSPINGATVPTTVSPDLLAVQGGVPYVMTSPTQSPLPPGVTPLRDVNIDILFTPSGQVLFTDSGMVCFWLRNETKPAPTVLQQVRGSPLSEIAAPQSVAGTSYRYFDRARMLAGGESLLVAVFTKTGAIGTYPVFVPDPSNQYNLNLREDMYKFVRDAFNRGL